MTDVALRLPRPIPGPSREYHFPRVERAELGNGLKVLTAPIHRLPIVTLLAVVDAGALWDEKGREGAATLVARLLLEGAGDLEGAELTERLEALGATVEAAADWDASVVSMTVTRQHLEPAVELFADILRRPLFRAREIERLKAERLAEILQLRSEPRGLADEAFESAVYDSASRYATSLGGSESSVAAIDADAIRGLYERRYSPALATLIVTGDIDAAKSLDLAKRHFGDWAGAAPTTTPRADTPARSVVATHHVVRPDSPQSELRIGHMGVPRTHPDYFDIVVMNAILGGLFNSRINMNLREAHAYTYGAFSAFDWRRDAGPFVASTAVRTDITAEAIREVLNEIERMQREPVKHEELSLATSYLDGVFPIRYETTAAVAGALANQIIFGLPDDYFDAYRSKVRQVTTESAWRAAQNHLHPERIQVVVVGDPVIEEKLRGLGLGEFISKKDRP